MYSVIKQFISDNNITSIVCVENNYPEMIDLLIKSTEFITTWATDDVVAYYKMNHIRLLQLRLYCVLHDIYAIPSHCECCNKPSLKVTKGKYFGMEGYRFLTACSKSCITKLSSATRRQTNLDRYGVENPFQSSLSKEKSKQTCLARYGTTKACQHVGVKDKIKQTNLDRYGVENPMQSGNIRAKARSTNNQRYGADYILQTEQGLNAYRNTMQQRYGVDNPIKNQDIRAKAVSTNRDRYGVDYPTQSYQVRQKIQQTNNNKYGARNYNQTHIPDETLEILENRILLEAYLYYHPTNVEVDLGISITTFYRALRSNNIQLPPNSSRGENSVVAIIKDAGISFLRNCRSVISNELDIFIPSHNVAVEFNGVYWHSSKFKDKKYHQQKALDCMKKGIQLISVWEDDWNNETKQRILINKIKSKLGLVEDRVYARKCVVKLLDPKTAHAFLDQNHIQGKTAASVWLGLFYQTELVAVLGLKKTKDEGVWDLVRFATSKTVVGGFSKLLAYFKSNYDWKTIFTFAHLDYSHGNVYEKNGFTKSHITPPGLFYVNGNVRIRREVFMKHKLSKLFDEYAGQSVREFLESKRIYEIYDCGSIRYEMHAISHHC